MFILLNATPVARQGQKAMGLGYYNFIVDEKIARLHIINLILLFKGKK